MTIPIVVGLSLSGCGTYDSTMPVTSHQPQSIAKTGKAIALSSKPALRTPSRIGVFTTRRTNLVDFSDVTKGMKKHDQIASIQSIDAFISKEDFRSLSDVMQNKGKLIQESSFLGLDVIVVCDQATTSDTSTSILGILTLGIIDFGVRKQDTQLTVVCMDARTGYVYGVMGRNQNGHTAKASLFSNDLFGSEGSHLAQTTRKEAVRDFPDFWSDVVSKYKK